MSEARLAVQKYGGTSVGDAERIKHVAERILARVQAGDRLVVVVSAMGDTTDELIALAQQMTDEPEARELDLLLSTGEIVSSTRSLCASPTETPIVDSTPHGGN